MKLENEYDYESIELSHTHAEHARDASLLRTQNRNVRARRGRADRSCAWRCRAPRSPALAETIPAPGPQAALNLFGPQRPASLRNRRRFSATNFYNE